MRIYQQSVTLSKRIRLSKAILTLHERGEYPSAAKISSEMGRKTKTLNGPECRARRVIFKELGIKLKRKGNWAEDWDEAYSIW